MKPENIGHFPFATPQWLRDEKFGIYTHWGVYSVHACGPNTTWYSHNLYRGGEFERKHFESHFGTFGPDNGYSDLVGRFTAEKFDADEWAEIFRNAGARFAGPVAIHHDGFAMWRTETTPFNAWDRGPRRDIVGEQEAAFLRQGLRFMTALHHAENYWFLETLPGTDAVRPENAYMFSRRDKWPYDRFCRLWLAQCSEIIRRYRPDMLWFDFGLHAIPDAWKMRMLQDYLAMAEENGIAPALCYKNSCMPSGQGLIDLELGRFNEMRCHDWITDTTVDAGQGWGYMEGATYKTGARLIHYLIDNVSKNGYMLLNVGPMADGTIPPQAQETLREIGAWLSVNGEAVYGTHPWYAFGEGPTEMHSSGMFSESEELHYTPQDIRYTAAGNSVYATVLARPAGDVLLGQVMPNLIPGEILSVKLLGHGRPLPYREEGENLRVAFPADAPQQPAYVLKITRDPHILEKLAR